MHYYCFHRSGDLLHIKTVVNMKHQCLRMTAYAVSTVKFGVYNSQAANVVNTSLSDITSNVSDRIMGDLW